MNTDHLSVEVKAATGEVLDILRAYPKDFKSGSTGYWTGGKLAVNGDRYQVSMSIVKIGSKPGA